MCLSVANEQHTSKAVNACRASPVQRRAMISRAESSAVKPSSTAAFFSNTSTASAFTGFSPNTDDRLRNAGLTEKAGFSVVAPTSVMSPISTACNSASCCTVVNLCISSTKTTVARSSIESRRRAISITSRMSLTPAVTADSRSNSRLVVTAMSSASVVFPVPGGPHKMMEDIRSASINLRSGPLGPTR